MNYYKANGLSLIELLVVISILALLSAMATPSLNQMIERKRSQSVAQKLMSHLHLAHSQAIQNKLVVTACPIVKKHCVKKHSKYIAVFFDTNENREVDPKDTVIRITQVSENNSFKLNASFGRPYLRFNSNGLMMEAGSFIYCPDREDLYGQVITVNYAGRAYIVKDKQQRQDKLEC